MLFTAASLVLLALAAPTQLVPSVKFVAASLLFIAPFLIVSVAVAAGAEATVLDRQIAVVFGGNRATVIVVAALFGALSPFCSCGVVPIIAGLLGAGAPLASVMAFRIGSPPMDPEMFILMVPVLGLEFTIAKTQSAIAIGLAAGFATEALVRRSVFADPSAAPCSPAADPRSSVCRKGRPAGRNARKTPAIITGMKPAWAQNATASAVVTGSA